MQTRKTAKRSPTNPPTRMHLCLDVHIRTYNKIYLYVSIYVICVHFLSFCKFVESCNALLASSTQRNGTAIGAPSAAFGWRGGSAVHV